MSAPTPWIVAWEHALYGPTGFYRRPEGPAGHFRTAGHAAPGALARALTALAQARGCRAVLDVGAGRGELLTALDTVGAPLALHGVDVVARPPGLPRRVGWSQGLAAVPDDAFDGALVVAWELLDVVPCPVLEVDDDHALRYVLVEPRSGRESLGAPVEGPDQAWCERWWPLEAAEPGDRVEVGLPRDRLWTHLVSRSRAGHLLAVDYGHLRACRPPRGSLSAFRSGRQVPPVPDGSCDLTTEVALDAVAAAGELAGAGPGHLTTQARALRELGTATTSDLLDPGGLGGFGWLEQVGPGR